LRRGDWLVVPEESEDEWRLNINAVPCEEITRVVIDDSLPLQTITCYYGGRTPLEHHEGPRLTVHIYRVTDDCEVDLLPFAEPGS
jgi:hypothetical protein